MATVGTDPEGQVKFLVTCIRFSSNGKVDFDSVANECNIVSKAAASKRFERILKSHGMKPGDLSKGGPVGTVASPAQSPANTGPKTPAKSTGKGTPKTKSAGKRTALPSSPTSNTKRAKLTASHPAVSSYHDEDDAEDDDLFGIKKEADTTSTTAGSYYDDPRGYDRDDDDLQLLCVVEKPNGCPIHESADYRGLLSMSLSSDTNAASSTQMLPLQMSNFRSNIHPLPVYQHSWASHAWPEADTCLLHGGRDAAQLIGI